MKYELQDCESGKKAIVYAPGIVEAMLDYLPWPTLDLKIRWEPATGKIEVVDIKTDFVYRLKLVES